MRTPENGEEPPLIPDQRREKLLRHLYHERVLSVHQLTGLLGVSHMTVRRDIAALEREGRALAIPGGVRLANQVHTEPVRRDKALANQDEKAAIAAAAARYLHDDMVLYLDAGTTTLALVSHLAAHQRVTVITNDFGIVDELSIGQIETIHVGGRVDHANRSTVGSLATDLLRQLNTDLAVISASSWSTKHGVTTPAAGKVEVKRAAMSGAAETILLADSSKYGSFSMYLAVPLKEFDVIVTDEQLSDSAAAAIRDIGVELLLAPVQPQDGAGADPGPAAPPAAGPG